MSLLNLGSNGSLALTEAEQRVITLKKELGSTHPDVLSAQEYVKAMKAQTRVPYELLPYTKAEKAAQITTAWGKIVKTGLIIFAILFLFIGGFAAFEAILSFIADNLLVSGIAIFLLIIMIAKRR